MKKLLSVISVGFLGLMLGVIGVKAETIVWTSTSELPTTSGEYNIEHCVLVNDNIVIDGQEVIWNINADSAFNKISLKNGAKLTIIGSSQRASTIFGGNDISFELSGGSVLSISNVMLDFSEHLVTTDGTNTINLTNTKASSNVSALTKEVFFNNAGATDDNVKINKLYRNNSTEFYHTVSLNNDSSKGTVLYNENEIKKFDIVKNGTQVALSVNPKKDYKVKKVDLTNAAGDKLQITNDKNVYTFSMPAGEVFVSVEYEKDEINYPQPIDIEDGKKDTVNKTVYSILNGANQTYKAGEDLVIRASGELDKFVKLLIDGEEVSKDNYTLASGSTIVTLKNSYLKTLKSGDHTVKFVYTDGEATTEFKVDKKSSNPKTTDMIRNTLVITVLGFVGLNLLVLIKKKGLI